MKILLFAGMSRHAVASLARRSLRRPDVHETPCAASQRLHDRGSSLLECSASLALGGLVLASSAHVAEASATLVRRARIVTETIDVARSLLEHELGAPCGAPMPCPTGFRCTVTRSPVTAVADRLIARVEREDGTAEQDFRTLAPAPSCGG